MNATTAASRSFVVSWVLVALILTGCGAKASETVSPAAPADRAPTSSNQREHEAHRGAELHFSDSGIAGGNPNEHLAHRSE